jgi:hypothetical protein
MIKRLLILISCLLLSTSAMAEHIVNNGNAKRYAIFYDEQCFASGVLDGNTCLATGHTVIHSEDVNEFIDALPATSFPDLPDSGMLEEGTIYNWDGQAVIVRQSHERTIYDPDETPALFLFFQEGEGTLDWIVGEQVEVGMKREYEGTVYSCIQPHVTQADWTPPNVPALWQQVQEPSDEWQAGTYYDVNEQVLYNEVLYYCIQAHTAQIGWEPPNVPALWGVVE